MMSSEFVAAALKAAGEKTCYALGMWGQKIEDGIVEQKKKQYPDWYGRNESKLVYGAYGFDCICFVKALLYMKLTACPMWLRARCSHIAKMCLPTWTTSSTASIFGKMGIVEYIMMGK